MRTEEEKLVQAPIKVVLGGKEYKVKPLVIKDSRAWRAKVVEALVKLPQYTQVTSDKPDEFRDALSKMFIAMPDMVVDLFFGYAKDLDREEIEASATDTEIAKAFDQIVGIAFPLARSLIGTMTNLSR